MNEIEINQPQKTTFLTDKRKTSPKKPKNAGNKSFRKHNNLRFIRTLERKQVGLKNKI